MKAALNAIPHFDETGYQKLLIITVQQIFQKNNARFCASVFLRLPGDYD